MTTQTATQIQTINAGKGTPVKRLKTDVFMRGLTKLNSHQGHETLGRYDHYCTALTQDTLTTVLPSRYATAIRPPICFMMLQFPIQAGRLSTARGSPTTIIPRGIKMWDELIEVYGLGETAR